MNKKLVLTLASSILILGMSACSSTPTKTEETKSTTTQLKQEDKKGPSQDELNAKIKSEAVEAVFTKANGDQYQKGQKLKVTGSVGVLLKSMSFPALSIAANNDNGVYTVQIIQSGIQAGEDKITLKNNIVISKNDKVTIYGSYEGKDKSGIPLINTTVVEKN